MNLIIFLYCCLGGNFKWLRIIQLSSTKEKVNSFLKHQEDKLIPTGRTSSGVHGSSCRVCSFGGQVRTVCCARPRTFSVTVTFTDWMDILCTGTKDLRHSYEMRKLQKGESTKFPSVYANHPANSWGGFTTHSFSHSTKNYQMPVGEK